MTPAVEFDTFAEADQFLRAEGFSSLSIETDDHYALYLDGDRKAEVGPGSVSCIPGCRDGNWQVVISDPIKSRRYR